MSSKDLAKKSGPELQKELERIEFELMRFGAQVATGGAGKDSGKIRELKRTVARIKTLQRQEEPKNS